MIKCTIAKKTHSFLLVHFQLCCNKSFPSEASDETIQLVDYAAQELMVSKNRNIFQRVSKIDFVQCSFISFMSRVLNRRIAWSSYIRIHLNLLARVLNNRRQSKIYLIKLQGNQLKTTTDCFAKRLIRWNYCK